jgi:carbonic anhydrase
VKDREGGKLELSKSTKKRGEKQTGDGKDGRNYHSCASAVNGLGVVTSPEKHHGPERGGVHSKSQAILSLRSHWGCRTISLFARTTPILNAHSMDNRGKVADAASSPASHDEILYRLKAGHDRFLAGQSIHPHANRDHLRELEFAQHPEVAILSCSDSRVPVELLFDTGFGDIFVVRNAGNACTPDTVASLEYAVAALNVKLLLVMGHEQCGAVSTACGDRQGLTPSLLELTREIRTGLLKHDKSLAVREACHIHPKITGNALLVASSLLQARVKSGEVQLHTACYVLDGGTIEWQGEIGGS